MWQSLPEDDLILTNVRSFDVKGFDPLLQTYMDLGYDPTSATLTTALQLYGLGHQGRIPPLVNDVRPDPQWPALNPNVGDNTSGIIRLTRVWDSWSTDYTNTPWQTLNPTVRPPVMQPVYPSYPAPYPIPLTGIQIQIRVLDPTSQKIKIHTIRQDFSKNLN